MWTPTFILFFSIPLVLFGLTYFMPKNSQRTLSFSIWAREFYLGHLMVFFVLWSDYLPFKICAAILGGAYWLMRMKSIFWVPIIASLVVILITYFYWPPAMSQKCFVMLFALSFGIIFHALDSILSKSSLNIRNLYVVNLFSLFLYYLLIQVVHETGL